MTLPKDHLDQLSPDQLAVLKKCGIPLDSKKIIEMPDERFNALINADHQELSDDEHNTWLKLSDELKIGIDEIKNNRAKVRDLVKQASQQQSKGELDESICSDILEGGKDNHWNIGGNGNRHSINEKPDFVDTLISKYHFKTLTETKVILYYDRNRGLFVENGHIIIESEAEKRRCNNKQVAETLGHVQRRTYTNRTEFDPDIEWIGCNNGMINVKTGETAPFSPSFMNTTRIPVTYNKDLIPAYEGNPVRSFFKMVENWNSQKIIENSPCPAIMKFLYDIMSPEDVELILDFLAYCMWREYKFNIWILLNGAGQNGKSTLLKLIARFLGRWNTSSESLDRLLNNRFAPANLYKKLINVDADLSSETLLRSTGILKKLTGGDEFPGEFKHKTAFSFINNAKLIFSCNEIPQTNDQTDAFFRRLIIMNFTTQFFGNRDDPNLIDKLCTEEEFSGLLCEILARLPRVLHQGIRRTTNEDLKETYEKYVKSANPVKYFADKAIVVDANEMVPKHDLYGAYKKFCKMANLTIQSNDSFSRDFGKLGFSYKQIQENKKKDRYWIGIKLADWLTVKDRDDAQQIFDEMEMSNDTIESLR